jgi:hypothetical protein
MKDIKHDACAGAREGCGPLSGGLDAHLEQAPRAARGSKRGRPNLYFIFHHSWLRRALLAGLWATVVDIGLLHLRPRLSRTWSDRAWRRLMRGSRDPELRQPGTTFSSGGCILFGQDPLQFSCVGRRSTGRWIKAVAAKFVRCCSLSQKAGLKKPAVLDSEALYTV